MNSSDHPSAYGYQPPPSPVHYPPPNAFGQPRLPEVLLKEMFVQVERKLFVLELKQNEMGRFLRFTQEANDRRTYIAIPSTGLEEIYQVLGEMIAANASLPPPPAP